MTNSQLTKEKIIEAIHSSIEGFAFLVIDSLEFEFERELTDAEMQDVAAALRELQERRKVNNPELKIAELINKFYERYPAASFKTESERSEALGYFMAGAELQCFGEFVQYEDLCGDE